MFSKFRRACVRPVVAIVVLGMTPAVGLTVGLVSTPSAAALVPASSVAEYQPTLDATNNVNSSSGPPGSNAAYGGRTVAATINPSNTNTVLTATESGGLWRSTDGGNHWTHIDTLVPFRMSSVAFAPNNASVVLATTWKTADSNNKGGIYRSTDGGLTWTDVTSGFACNGGNFNAGAISYESSSTNVYVGTDCGIAFSTNAGATWNLKNLGSVSSVAAVAGGKVYSCGANGWGSYTLSGGVLNQTQAPQLIGGNACPTPFGILSQHDLDVSPLNSNVVVTMAANSSTSECGGTASNPAGVYTLYESDDGGANWTARGNACTSRHPNLTAHAATDPTKFELYYSGGLDVHHITCDSTATPQCPTAAASVTQNTDHADTSQIVFAMDSSDCAKFVADDGGLETTTDCGSTFHMAAGSGSGNGGYDALQVYQVTGEVHPAGTDLYLGTQDNSSWASGDNGGTWTNGVCCEGFYYQVPLHGAVDPNQQVKFVSCAGCNNITSQHPVFSGCFYNSITAPCGLSNNPSSGTSPGADTGAPWLLPPTANTYVQWMASGANNNLYLSADSGSTWSAVSGATIPGQLVSHPFVSGPASDPTIYQAVCASSCGNSAPSTTLSRVTGVRSSSATVANASNGTDRFGSYQDGEGAWLFQEPSIGVDPNNPLHLIAADTTTNSMVQSTDGGQTWTADAGLTNLVTGGGSLAFFVPNVGTQSHAIAWDPNDAHHILVGTESAGIIASFDGGQTWTKMIGSEKVTAVTSFFFDDIQHDILVSSYGRGLWKLTLPTTDLSITKSHHPDPAVAGSDLFYDLSVSNSGGSAPNTTVTDTLPSDVTYVANNLPSPAGCTAVGQVVTCNLGNLASGQTVNFSIQVTVNSNADVSSGAHSIQNTATVTSNGVIDSDPSNNTATDTVLVEESADLQVTTVCAPSTNVSAGTPITCTVYVDNHGPSDARSVVVDDTIRSNGTFDLANINPASCAPATAITGGKEITCSLGTIQAASSTVQGRATLSYTITNVNDAQNLTTVASARSSVGSSSGTPDPNTSNNQSTVPISVSALADLSVTKTGPTTATAGTDIGPYTVTVANNGPSTATNVVLTDNVPAGVTIVSIVPNPGTIGCTAGVPGDSTRPTTCAIGTLTSGGSASVNVTLHVLPSTTGTLSNDARVSSDTFDANLSNNLAHADTVVSSSADLAVTMTASPNPVVAGQTLSLKAHITNGGPSTAPSTTLDIALPNYTSLSGTQITGASGSCGLLGPLSLHCTLGTLNLSASADVFVTLTVGSGAPNGATLTATATVSSAATDPNTTNNTASASVTVSTSADLTITLTSDMSVYHPSTTIHYTVTISNAGPSDAQGLTVVQTISPSKLVQFTTVNLPSTSCTVTPTTITCHLGTLASGATTGFQSNAFIRGNRGTITSTASITSTTPDPNTSTNSSTRIVTVK